MTQCIHVVVLPILTHFHNLTVNPPTCKFLEEVRKPANLKKTHMNTGRTCKISLRQKPELRMEPVTLELVRQSQARTKCSLFEKKKKSNCKP